MFKSATRSIRLLTGIVASLAVFFVLDLIPWKWDVTNFSSAQLYFFLGVTAAVSVFVATLAGAMIARSNFVIPAFIIAIVVWLLAVSFLDATSKAFDPSDLVPYLVGNLGGFLLTLCGAILGALVGSSNGRHRVLLVENAT